MCTHRPEMLNPYPSSFPPHPLPIAAKDILLKEYLSMIYLGEQCWWVKTLDDYCWMVPTPQSAHVVLPQIPPPPKPLLLGLSSFCINGQHFFRSMPCYLQKGILPYIKCKLGVLTATHINFWKGMGQGKIPIHVASFLWITLYVNSA